MSELTTIARPYAKAAFDFAIEQSAVEKWTDMLGFAAAVAEDETVKAYLSSSLSAQKLADTVISICGEQLDQYGQNLIRLMAENKRLSAIPTVFEEFKHYVEEHQAIAEVEVTSAQPSTLQFNFTLRANLFSIAAAIFSICVAFNGCADVTSTSAIAWCSST